MGPVAREIRQRSAVPARADVVWDRVVAPGGINDELGPFVRMSVPARARGKTIDAFAAGDRVGRSWLLLFGVVPFDYDDIRLTVLEPGRRFVEESTMLSMRRWHHERTLLPHREHPDTTVVEDRVVFELRAPLRWVPWLPEVVRAVIAALFRHRHRRLRARFSGPLP